ncbi:MAG: bifunctional DNA-formamidopyrimidine glycosylase/DNA-(apurinic or apyrimidinic site) lyase [Chloroflexota bacterium]|nr:bifunctional DNA-formamidopyrimidine glycosylase/DNA-(apurinic or apyrimidinic site) lyase [Chloroflexota bacterium]
MPELPEVENTVRDLRPHLVGRRIEGAQVFWSRLLHDLSPEVFDAALRGRQIINTERRGKFLIFPLDDGSSLLLHLRMTGKLWVEDRQTPVDKHTHVLIDLDNGRQLRYQDVRKFGRFYLVQDRDVVLGKLGPEPLSDEFSPIDLLGMIQHRTTAIKALLLDQQVVAGIGNVYADEALFRAGIHPLRPGVTLTLTDCNRLYASVRQILAEAIREGGSTLGQSTLTNFRRPNGVQGRFQQRHQVYRLTGKPCPVCGATVQKIKVAQRSTHFCPACQPIDGFNNPLN